MYSGTCLPIVSTESYSFGSILTDANDPDAVDQNLTQLESLNIRKTSSETAREALVMTRDSSGCSYGYGIGKFFFRPLVFKPANESSGRAVNAQCRVKLGWDSMKVPIVNNTNSESASANVIILERRNDEESANITIQKGGWRFSPAIGEAKIDLCAIAVKGKILEWVDVFKKNTVTGKVLIEIEFKPVNVLY